jgi:hypothetical protein
MSGRVTFVDGWACCHAVLPQRSPPVSGGTTGFRVELSSQPTDAAMVAAGQPRYADGNPFAVWRAIMAHWSPPLGGGRPACTE